MPWRLFCFDDFHVLRNIELNWIFSWWISHFTYTLTLFVYSCFVFMSHIYASLNLSVGYHVSFMFHEKYFWCIPCLKDFVLVNKFFHLTSCGILRYGRVFQTYYIFKSIFEKPLPSKGRLDGRPCSCMLYIENLFKHKHEMGGRLYEIYTWSYCCFNWYHWTFSIGIKILFNFNWYQDAYLFTYQLVSRF